MRVATLRAEGPSARRDGTLVAVAAEADRCAPVPGGPGTLQEALDDWAVAEGRIAAVCAALDAGDDPSGSRPLVPAELESPLPRCYLWAEGSTYLSHMRRCRSARGAAMPDGVASAPVIYHGGAGRFLPPTGEIRLGSEGWGLDLEATIAVIVDDVPERTGPEEALDHIRLVLLVNDLTLRNLLPAEAATGVGFFRSKPERPCAPVAVSPEALGPAWLGDRLAAGVRSTVRGQELGEPRAELDCSFGFGELISEMTTSRPLRAGSVVGAGTVSNVDSGTGFGCLAELRAEEGLRGLETQTAYLGEGDTVRIEAVGDGGRSIFGAIEHTVRVK